MNLKSEKFLKKILFMRKIAETTVFMRLFGISNTLYRHSRKWEKCLRLVTS